MSDNIPYIYINVINYPSFTFDAGLNAIVIYFTKEVYTSLAKPPL